jgi:hypothetical protein
MRGGGLSLPDDESMQFATNHLGHFDLTLGLHDALAEAGARPRRRRELRGSHQRRHHLGRHQLRQESLRRMEGSEAAPHTPGLRRGFAAYAVDPDAAARLWQMSLAMIGDAGRHTGA